MLSKSFALLLLYLSVSAVHGAVISTTTSTTSTEDELHTHVHKVHGAKVTVVSSYGGPQITLAAKGHTTTFGGHTYTVPTTTHHRHNKHHKHRVSTTTKTVHGSTVTVVTSQGGAAYTLAPSGSGVKTTFAGQTLIVAPTSTSKKVHKAHKHKHEHDVATVTKTVNGKAVTVVSNGGSSMTLATSGATVTVEGSTYVVAPTHHHKHHSHKAHHHKHGHKHHHKHGHKKHGHKKHGHHHKHHHKQHHHKVHHEYEDRELEFMERELEFEEREVHNGHHHHKHHHKHGHKHHHHQAKVQTQTQTQTVTAAGAQVTFVQKKHHHHHHNHKPGNVVVNVVGVPAPTKSVKAKKPKLIHKTIFKKKNGAQTSSAIGGLISMVIGAVVGAWFTL